MYTMGYEMYSITDPTANPVAISFYRLLSLFSGALNFQIFEDVSSDKFIKRYLRNAIKKEYRDKNANLKDRLMGKYVLQSAHHSLWDLIAVEVTKFWGELKRLEAKEAYIYSTLEK